MARATAKELSDLTECLQYEQSANDVLFHVLGACNLMIFALEEDDQAVVYSTSFCNLAETILHKIQICALHNDSFSIGRAFKSLFYKRHNER